MIIAFSVWSFLWILLGILVLWLLIDRLFIHRHGRLISRSMNWVAGAIILLPISLLTVTLISSWHHASLYDRASVGAIWDNSREPDASTKYGDYQILFFFGGVFDKEEYDVPVEITSLEDLPRTYCAIEMMIDPDGNIVAKTHCGEELHIHTMKGTYKGACLRHLEDSLFQEVEK